MKAKKRDKSKRYEIDMLEHAEKMTNETGIFSTLPIQMAGKHVRNMKRDDIELSLTSHI